MKHPFAVLLSAAALAGCGAATDSAPPHAAGADPWVGIWGAALHQGAATAADTSFRMIVRPTLDAPVIRLRLANSHGTAPVRFESVHAAIRDVGPAVVAGSDQAVRFGGVDAVTVPVGAEALSDPVTLAVTPDDELAVSFHVADASTLSQHGSSNAVSYLASGDHAAEPDGSAFTSAGTSWWALAGVDGARADSPGTFVALGDSITDGNNPPEANNRWPDYFADRLAAAGMPIGVLNAGIGANQVTQDTTFLGSSEAAVKRFERDVLQRPAVRWMIVFEGTNDLAQGIAADAIFAGLLDIAARARERGIVVIAGTVTPRGKDPTWRATPAFETERVKLNDLIRANVGSGKSFDALADFDAALGAPAAPDVMSPQYDSGDGLHPNPLGLMLIADTVPLDALK